MKLPKQQKLMMQDAEIPEMASIPVDVTEIPQNLSDMDRQVLLDNWDKRAKCVHSVWFKDTADVRRILGIKR